MFQEMELLSSNIKKLQETETPKKIPYITGNENPRKASYIPGNGTFQLKNKKNPLLKKFLIFREMELSNSKIKKIVIFSQKKAFLTFSQKKPPALSNLSPQKPTLP